MVNSNTFKNDPDLKLNYQEAQICSLKVKKNNWLLTVVVLHLIMY
jgi:hypothetical protein